MGRKATPTDDLCTAAVEGRRPIGVFGGDLGAVLGQQDGQGGGPIGVGVGVLYSITTFIRAITSLLQIRQVARRRSTTCNRQGQSPTREEHTNNPVQKPNFRGHAVPAVSKFEPGQGTYLPSL
jgi:hypothetical protein